MNSQPSTLNPQLNSPRGSRPCLRTWLALGWLIGFFVFFFSLSLPNNSEIPRLDVWRDLPRHFLSIIDPLPDERAPRSGWEYFPQRLDLMLVAAIILAGAWALGHLLLRLIEPLRPERSVERTVFAFGIGLSGLSLLTLLFGLAGLLSRGLFAAVIGACLTAEIVLRFRRGIFRDSSYSTAAAPLPPSSATPAPHSAFRIPHSKLLPCLCIAVVLPFLLSLLLGAMLPSTDFDVKEYHLQGPKEFFQAGRITFLPHNVYTSFPFLTEMLSLLAMVLRGDWFRGALAGKAVLMCFAPLTALGLFAAGRRFFGPTAGWLAAVIYLTTPWTYRVSIIAYTEGGLCFFLFATLLAVMIGVEKLAANESGKRPFLLAGLLAGSAMACKYPGVLSVVIPLAVAVCATPFLLKLTEPQRRRVAFQSFGVFSVGVMLTIGPWLIKNTVETGNPVYPLLYTVFGGRDWDAELNAQWRQGHSHSDAHSLAFWITDVTARNDWLSPLLYGLAPLAFFSAARRRTVGWLWVYAAFLFLTWWAFTHRLDRFWVPMIPVVALLAGAGAAAIRGTVWRYGCATCVAAAALFNLGMITSGASGYNAFLIDLDYSREWTTHYTAPTIARLNGELPPNSKVLCVGDAEVFDARFPLVYHTVFDRSIFQQWCAVNEPGTPADQLSLRAPEEIRRKLKQEGITHVLVNWQEILRYRLTYWYSDFVTPERFSKLQVQGVLGTPLTFGVIENADLAERIERNAQRWSPVVRKSADGRTVHITSVSKGLSKEEQKEIDKWAPPLITRCGGERVFITSQIFPVQP